ncbi:MAG: hypothetical protein VR64_16610 [Desulfatitalea sp. BRH_c12]|nr:MAG: hypothetical protein VR64_16610 [Desulfatitalea sp. BRH_c12]
MNTRTGKSGFFLLLLVTLLWSISVPPAALANPKIAELERKIADLNLLHQQLKDRMLQAKELSAALAEQEKMLVSEISVLVRSKRITNWEQARQNTRLHYNIELLRTLMPYMDELNDKLTFYQDGRDRLGYLRQLAEDDLRMITALNNLKIDALTTQISLVINRYLPEAHVIQIDPQRIAVPPSQHIWERVAR